MDSEITINDVEDEIKKRIDEYTKDSFNNIYNFDKVNNINDLMKWFDVTKSDIKILKNLKLLEYELESKYIFNYEEIKSYLTLACKPERINTIKKKIKSHLPITNKFVYYNVEKIK